MEIKADGVHLAAERWPGAAPRIVLLHSGVTDRRGWYETVESLAGWGDVVAYDRRGYGDTPPTDAGFRHVDDLYAVLDELGDEPVWLVASSGGGAVALDAALEHPERFAGLVLLAPAVSGAPAPGEFDPLIQRFSDDLDAAAEAGDLAEVNRLEAWVWLDGPTAPEGRIGGAVRELFLEMNGIALASGLPEDAGDAGFESWPRLAEIDLPVTVAWGDLDLPHFVAGGETLAARLPRATAEVLTGTAHLPYLEQPARVAELIRRAIGG